MTTDFLDAHERHWQDAGMLYDSHRWANADHLYGFSTECGLKRLMLKFGMSVDGSGAPTKSADKKHADKIWDRYTTYLSGRHATAYALPSQNPFGNWKAEQRYVQKADFDQSLVDPHRDGTMVVRTLVAKAKTDGLL